jgi:hypothetical protein
MDSSSKMLMPLSDKKIALDCGFNPNDSVLVAYLPKLDTVIQELYDGDRTLHVVDGVVLDMTSTNPVRWWRVRNAAFSAKLPLIGVTYAGTARDFSIEARQLKKVLPPLDYEGAKLHMRAYSHGPWICIEPEQLEKVYIDERNE